jgi:hypothetical protein
VTETSSNEGTACLKVETESVSTTLLVVFPVCLFSNKLNFPKSLARSKTLTFLVRQVSPIYCHFAFSDLNIFSGTCFRVVYIQYPLFSARNYVYMYVCTSMYTYFFILILLLTRFIITRVVQFELTVSTLHNYVRMLTRSG